MNSDDKNSTTESDKRVAGKRGEEAPAETEAARVGGIEPAKRQAKQDWEDSSKESGE